MNDIVTPLAAMEPMTRAWLDQAAQACPPGQRVAWLAQQLDRPEGAVLAALAQAFVMQPAPMAWLRQLVPSYELVPFSECQRRSCLLAAAPEGTTAAKAWVAVITDPTDRALQQWLEARTRGKVLKFALAAKADLHALLAVAEKAVRAMDAVGLQQGAARSADEHALSISIAHIDATESQVVRLVDSTLYDALRSGASDIHLETGPQGMTIKYRLDGVLEMVKQVDDPDIADQAISRIKVVAELDISERRIPQDGRFKALIDGSDIDFRVSIMPNLFGEDAVLRVLDRRHLTGQFRALSLDTLGFAAESLEFIRGLARLPYGLLLVTGPTGSGKTTTLYAAISEINTGLDKIVTIEDPIEYQLAGVLQIPVNEKKGLTFVRGLRSILRHDPDKIMVGEIRDAETAHIAVQAALTGHQVFTTVHANNVFDVIGRFANMGVDSYSLVAALNGILAQRLVRLVCKECAVPNEPTADLLRRSGLTAVVRKKARFRAGLGCAHCRGSGYRGRQAIAETLRMSDALRDQMVQRAPLSSLRQLARSEGFTSLREAAVRLALAGETTLEEINRVTPLE